VSTGAGSCGSTVHLSVGTGRQSVTFESKWKAIGNRAFRIVAFLVLVGGSSWARSESPRHREVTELAGVKLGMTPREVVSALGQPTLVDTFRGPGKRTSDTAFGYIYARSYDPDYSLQLVFVSREAPRLSIVCEVHANTSALGLSSGSKERQVVRKLGKPDEISVSADRRQKIISYAQWKVAYFIEKRKVIGICISSEGIVTFVDAA
jgi:hypothetical protein